MISHESVSSQKNSSPPALCVAVHDVAPNTWQRCERLMEAVAAVAPLPLTLLVVPNYHRGGEQLPPWYRDALEARRAAGDELALHGYVHLDEALPPRTPLDWWKRRILTASEGEFAALGAQAASARLRLGLEWFARQGWKPEGFVAPAWLLSSGSWQALQATTLSYTTTSDAFHLLNPPGSVRTHCFAYSTRSRGRRALSLGWNGRRLPLADRLPVRLALHPDDSRFAAVTTQIQRIIEALLRDRTPMTKAALAARLQAPGRAAGTGQGVSKDSDTSATPPPSATPASTSLG